MWLNIYTKYPESKRYTDIMGTAFRHSQLCMVLKLSQVKVVFLSSISKTLEAFPWYIANKLIKLKIHYELTQHLGFKYIQM